MPIRRYAFELRERVIGGVEAGFAGRVVKDLDALAQDVRQRFLRISELIEEHGLSAMRGPHVKHLKGKLWEMRMKGRDGSARAIYSARSTKEHPPSGLGPSC